VVLEFSGEDNLSCRCFHQLVLVQPNTLYRFEAWVKTEGITTESGPRLEVADAYSAGPPPAYSPSLVGTSDWQLLTVNFRSGLQTRLVRVALVRLPSARLHGRFAGTVRATEFSFRATRATP
jgi:hypothetical protein